jgi:hypothetical protein
MTRNTTTGAFVAAILACGLGDAAGLPAPGSDPLNSAPQTQLQQWVAQLDSDQFLVRESATRNLIAAGMEAIEPVVSSLHGDRRELVTRGIYILQELAKSGQWETEQAARTALEKLAGQGGTWVARRASVTLDALNVIRQERAIKSLAWLGAKIESFSGPFGGDPADRPYSIQIDDGWQGSDDDIRQVQWLVDTHKVVFRGAHVKDRWIERIKSLPNLKSLSIVHAQVTDQGLVHLQDMTHLEQLNIWYTPIGDQAIEHLGGLKGAQAIVLYGTQLSPEGASALQSRLANVNVIVKSGAFLGVGANPNGEGCIISTVHPGSAAEQAGLNVGDVITHYKGDKVGNFEALRELIGENRPGDEVEMKIMRGPQTLTKRVRLGEWNVY